MLGFDARKILTTGKGGIITTNDGAAAERLRSLRAHAASVPMVTRHTTSSFVLENYTELGFNYKLTDFQSAIGIVQMGRIQEFIDMRRRLARRYDELLAGADGIELPLEPAGYRHRLPVVLRPLDRPASQLNMMKAMAKRDVATRRIIAIHKESGYRQDYSDVSMPLSEAAAERTLLLPMFAGLTAKELEQVAAALIASLRETGSALPDEDGLMTDDGAEAAVNCVAQRLVILGAGGNAADIIDIVDALNSVRPSWHIMGLLDDWACLDSTVYGRHVIGKLKDAASFSADTWFINAIGSEVSFAKREQIIAATRVADKRFATLVHPGAAVSRGAVMGAGSYACFGVSVGNGVGVGRHVHIGVGAVLGHDASVGDFTLIAPRAVVSGCVRIAKSAYIGAGSSVKQNVTIGEGALVGLGAVVVRDVPDATTVVGNPARAR